jgi:hypothetical protein
MFAEVLREVQNGKGYKVVKVPFAKISEHGDVKIDGVEEWEACIEALIKNISDEEWEMLFAHGIINKYGYAIHYEFSDNVGKEPTRYMYLLKRPVQPGSAKTLVDDSPLSKVFVFGEAMVEKIFGNDFKLDKISLLLSEADSPAQVRHINCKARIPKDNEGDMAYTIIMPFKFRGVMAVWPFSQFFVRATQEAINQGLDESRMHSFVRDKIESNPECKIDFDSCEKNSVFFGTDELLIVGENTVRACEKNTMYVDVFCAHFYVSRKEKKSLNDKPVLLENLVWDLTRKGAQSVDIRFNQIETLEDYNRILAKKKTDDASTKEVDSVERNVADSTERKAAAKEARNAVAAATEAPVLSPKKSELAKAAKAESDTLATAATATAKAVSDTPIAAKRKPGRPPKPSVVPSRRSSRKDPIF